MILHLLQILPLLQVEKNLNKFNRDYMYQKPKMKTNSKTKRLQYEKSFIFTGFGYYL